MPVLHRPEVVVIGVKSYIEKHAICLKDYIIQYVHGDLCKHLGIDSNTDHLRFQSRSSMYIRGLIRRNFAELAEAVPIAFDCILMYLPRGAVGWHVSVKFAISWRLSSLH